MDCHPRARAPRGFLADRPAASALAPELLALLCALSSNHPFAFADRDGKAVSVKQVLELGSRFVPTALVPFIKKRGNAPLSFYVKTVGRPQVLF